MRLFIIKCDLYVDRFLYVCVTETNNSNPQYSKRVMKEIAKERLAKAQSTGPKICIDLSMTDSMSDKVGDWLANLLEATVINGDPIYFLYLLQEISRLAGQLRRLYGSNKKATRPFHIFLTNMSNTSRLYKECLRMNDGFLNYMVFIFFKLAESAGEYFWQEERIVDTNSVEF